MKVDGSAMTQEPVSSTGSSYMGDVVVNATASFWAWQRTKRCPLMNKRDRLQRLIVLKSWDIWDPCGDPCGSLCESMWPDVNKAAQSVFAFGIRRQEAVGPLPEKVDSRLSRQRLLGPQLQLLLEWFGIVQVVGCLLACLVGWHCVWLPCFVEVLQRANQFGSDWAAALET